MLTIYADGACSGNPGPAGAAIVVLTDSAGTLVEFSNRQKALGTATNQIAELEAAIMALDFALDQPPSMPVTVRSDSQYVVKGINEWMSGWIKNGWRNAAKQPVANKDIWLVIVQKLDEIRTARRQSITFAWVKGHSTDPFNNRVDELAVAASKMKPGAAGGISPAVKLNHDGAAPVTKPAKNLLTYKSFSSVDSEAIKDAYLFNLVQAVGASDRLQAGEILVDYALGDMTFEEAEAELEQWVADGVPVPTS